MSSSSNSNANVPSSRSTACATHVPSTTTTTTMKSNHQSSLSRVVRGLVVGLPLVAATLLGFNEAQALKSISVSEIMSRGKSGFGYSYFWGHGRWQGGGVTNPGVCSGSCGKCSHKGANGADCSGFVAKAWRVPDSNTPLEVDMHPYGTSSFRYQKTYWKPVSRNAAKEGDAFVYNSGGKGHIVLFQGWTGKGTAKIYEAAGCKTKIGSSTKSLGSKYIAIRRDAVTSSATANKAESNVLCTIDAHCGAGKFCCDSDGDGQKHCSTQSCVQTPVGGAGDPGDNKTTCDVASPNCANPYPNCCDNDGDGAYHCTSSTCKGCGHDVNTTGASLKAECNACTTKLCSLDPYCCEQRWDVACVQRAKEECGQ
jgi:hypothetical protein